MILFVLEYSELEAVGFGDIDSVVVMEKNIVGST